jgi:hypothetical protein
MWSVLGLIYKAFKTTAIDFMEGGLDSVADKGGGTALLIANFI